MLNGLVTPKPTVVFVGGSVVGGDLDSLRACSSLWHMFCDHRGEAEAVFRQLAGGWGEETSLLLAVWSTWSLAPSTEQAPRNPTAFLLPNSNPNSPY